MASLRTVLRWDQPVKILTGAAAVGGVVLYVSNTRAYDAQHPSGEGGGPSIAAYMGTSSGPTMITEPGDFNWFNEFVEKMKTRKIPEFNYTEKLTPSEVRVS